MACAGSWSSPGPARQSPPRPAHFCPVACRYAYSIASATTLDKPIRYALHVEMQLQPPWDKTLMSEVRSGRRGVVCLAGSLKRCAMGRAPAAALGVVRQDRSADQVSKKLDCLGAGCVAQQAGTSASLPWPWRRSVDCVHVAIRCCALQNGKPAYMIHFTYGNDFDEKGVFTPGKVGFWHW